jgi:hypothetical protein
MSHGQEILDYPSVSPANTFALHDASFFFPASRSRPAMTHPLF